MGSERVCDAISPEALQSGFAWIICVFCHNDWRFYIILPVHSFGRPRLSVFSAKSDYLLNKEEKKLEMIALESTENTYFLARVFIWKWKKQGLEGVFVKQGSF